VVPDAAAAGVVLGDELTADETAPDDGAAAVVVAGWVLKFSSATKPAMVAAAETMTRFICVCSPLRSELEGLVMKATA
jgi:hypothetical protein